MADWIGQFYKLLSLQEINVQINELLELTAQIAALHKQGKELGSPQEEMAFYDALAKPETIKGFYENDYLVAATRELMEILHKNRAIDLQKKEIIRAGNAENGKAATEMV